MKIITDKIAILLIPLFLLSCGFEVLKKNEINNLYFKEIEALGDKRINFKIKNNLLLNSKNDSKNIVILKLNTEKIKEIKEKNVKNETTKYSISLTAKLNFSLSTKEKLKKDNLQVTVTGDYLVGDNNSITLNNEKKLIENLVEEISEDILKNISFKINDI